MKETISTMSIEEKVGQMIIGGFYGNRLTDNIKKMVNDIFLGGFILFRENIISPAQLAMLTDSIKKTAANSSTKIPLFISIDHEGGKIVRVDEPFTQFPPAEIIGDIGSKELAIKYSAAMAKELAAVGINMNFCPVLDVNTNKLNSVIGDRAFGSTPDIVSTIGVEVIKGMRKEKIIPVAKHFPGHGGTQKDSHFELPVYSYPYERLQQVDLPPYVTAIKKDIEAIMTAHVLYPCIDKENCATFSSKICKDLLRRKLNFKGLIISDDMCMKAVIPKNKTTSDYISAISSGVDMLIIARDFNTIKDAHTQIVHGVKNKIIPLSHINNSVKTILDLKERYLLNEKKISPVEIEKIIGNDEHKKLSREIITAYKKIK